MIRDWRNSFRSFDRFDPCNVHRGIAEVAAQTGVSVLRGKSRSLASLGMTVWVALLVALGSVSLWSAPAAAQSPSARAKEVGTKIKCLCKGCDMSAGLCAHPGGSFSGPCDTAKSELREIDQHLGNGETEQQVIEAFVRQYGTIAYMEPPKHGFGLVAWLMPILYSVLGLGVVILVVRKWASHRPAPTAGVAVTSPIAREALARARAQAARETED